MPDQPFNLLSVSRLEDAGFGMNTTDRPRQMTYKDMAFNFYRHEGVYPWSEGNVHHAFMDADENRAMVAGTTVAVSRDKADWQLLFS